MASIRFRDGKYRVQIRKRNIELSRTFDDLETAELWSKYKENLIDEMDAFEAPKEEMITLLDAIEMKLKSNTSTDKKSIQDIQNIKVHFSKFLTMDMNSIKFEDLKEHGIEMFKTDIRVGGSRDNENTGVIRKPSSVTVTKRFAYLSTVYSNLIAMGINIENVALRVKTYLDKNHGE